MRDKELHFFNDTQLAGRKTNVLTRKKMIEGFDNIEELEKVVVHCVACTRAERKDIRKQLETDKVIVKPVYLPELFSNRKFRSVYHTLILNRLLEAIYFWRFITGARNTLSYVWGLQPSIAVLASKFSIDSTSFILELDDYMFGENSLRDHIYLKAAKSAVKVSTVSEQTKEDLVERDINPEKIEVLPNSVDIDEFDLNAEKTGIREELDIPAEKFVVTYTGHLYDWKGVETLVNSVDHLQFEDLEVLLIGGNQQEIEKYRNLVESRNLENVIRVVGYVSREKIPKYQNASDVLVVPNTSKSEKSAKYTSPVKIREYMASGTPVIASKLPSIKEAVSQEEVFYFEPDSPEDLAEKINLVREKPERAVEKSENALEKVKKYSWTDRAKVLVQNQFR